MCEIELVSNGAQAGRAYMGAMPAGRLRKPEPIFDPSFDRSLILRPGKGWTPWADGRGGGHIERMWWQVRVLHFPRWNISHWYDGSLLVGIENWGGHYGHWSMRKPPAYWAPPPPGYLVEAEAAWFAFRTQRLHSARHAARLAYKRRLMLDPLPLDCRAGS